MESKACSRLVVWPRTWRWSPTLIGFLTVKAMTLIWAKKSSTRPTITLFGGGMIDIFGLGGVFFFLAGFDFFAGFFAFFCSSFLSLTLRRPDDLLFGLSLTVVL